MRASEGTHQLEIPDGEKSQDTARMWASRRHLLPGGPRRRDKSGHGNNGNQKESLTNWGSQTERQVMIGIWKE